MVIDSWRVKCSDLYIMQRARVCRNFPSYYMIKNDLCCWAASLQGERLPTSCPDEDVKEGEGHAGEEMISIIREQKNDTCCRDRLGVLKTKHDLGHAGSECKTEGARRPHSIQWENYFVNLHLATVFATTHGIWAEYKKAKRNEPPAMRDSNFNRIDELCRNPCRQPAFLGLETMLAIAHVHVAGAGVARGFCFFR